MRNLKLFRMLFTAIVGGGLLCGCSNSINKLPTNEVLTTIPYDLSKETLVINVCDGLDCVKIKAELDKQFPDINIVLRHGNDINSSVFGDTGEIFLSLTPNLSPEVEDLLLDLSAFESTSHYYTTSLNSCASINNNKQYLLPLAANIRGIVYNKTLFEENGWEAPKNKTEFVDLCHTIDKSGIVDRAFQPSFYYNGEVLNFAEFNQMSNMFDTLDYFSWAENYGRYGIGSSSYILPCLIDSFKFYLDQNIIKLSDFSILPSQRSKMLYKERSVAMTIETQNATSYALDYQSTDEFSMIPFFSGDEAGDDYVLASPIAYVGVNAKIKEKGNETKMKIITKFLDFIATKKGQDVFVPEGNAAISQLKNAEIDTTNNVMLKNVISTMNAGRMVPPRLFFKSDITLCRSALFDVINGIFNTDRKNENIIKEDRAVTFDEAVSYFDSINKIAIYNSKSTVVKTYATAEKAFTVLETSQYLAQMIKNVTGADISLYLSNTLSRGNNLAIQKGPLVKTKGGVYSYDFVASMDSIKRVPTSGDDKKVVTLKMTGEQIIKALEVPMETGDIEMFEPFFVSAGLKIEFAPWAKKGSRYLKVTLADGSTLQLDKTYTVAAWNNTVDLDLIQEYVKYYDNTITEMLEAQLVKDVTIKPFTDGRFKLNCSVVDKK